ncbi:amidase [Microvirga aerilata]|uniref:amidase n=1 Tax=Microvirga aerilata TaxID=670292 RepID=UPI0036389DE6
MTHSPSVRSLTPHSHLGRPMLLDRDPAHAFMPYPAVPVPHAPSGPLSGLSFAAKDLFDVAGYPTSAGSPHMLALSGIKTRTAPTVQRLLDAGASLAGKTITDELAFSMSGKNAHFGTPVNGGAPDRIPGGSSSGSAAAVSNGLCDFALGTDTGGSVRAPANHCGLFGIRPTHGRVSLELCHDLAPSFDTCGYFTRDGATFVRVGEVLLGADSQPLPDTPRVLLARDAFALLAEEVKEALAPALRRAEAVLGQSEEVEVATEGFTSLYWAMRHIQSREAWTVDGPMIERYRPPLGPGVADRFEFSRAVTDSQVAEAQEVRAAFRERFGALLGAMRC